MLTAIYDSIEQNPNKDRTLSRIKKILEQDPNETWELFTLKPLDPPGPISLLCWHKDTLYPPGTPSLRKQIFREAVLDYQTRAEQELSGRRWPRKKVHDLIAGELSVDIPVTSAILEDALSELSGFQKIVFNRKEKSVLFYPTDMRVWKSDKPILFADSENRWVHEAKKDVNLIQWLELKEQEGWTISWPTADGKLEDLKTALLAKNLTAHLPPGSPIGTKIKKEDWARTLGRAEAIEQWTKLNLKT